MPDIEKVFLKMRTQVNNICFAELEKVLVYYGFALVRQKGSHCIFRADDGKRIVIPKHNPIKAVYVKMVLALVREQNEGSRLH